MSLVGVVNLAERLLNQNSSQGQETPLAQNAASAAGGKAVPATVTQDLFTHSGQNGQTQTTAQDAGLFSVPQFSFFSAAADFLLGQNTAQVGATGNGGGSGAAVPTVGAAAPTVGAPAPGAVGAPVAAAGKAGSNGANASNGVAAAVAAATGGTGSATNGNTALTAQQQQLQTLNTSLASLGLTPAEIQQIDQIAAIIGDFNPAFFAVLAFQLQQLAQSVAVNAAAGSNGAANTAVPAGTASANAGANPSPANGAGNTGAANAGTGNPGAFQVQELFIRFSGVEGQAAANGNGSGGRSANAGGGNGNVVQFAAFNLQIEEVSLTLVNGNGQAAQIQVPTAQTSQSTVAPARTASA